MKDALLSFSWELGARMVGAKVADYLPNRLICRIYARIIICVLPVHLWVALTKQCICVRT